MAKKSSTIIDVCKADKDIFLSSTCLTKGSRTKIIEYISLVEIALAGDRDSFDRNDVEAGSDLQEYLGKSSLRKALFELITLILDKVGTISVIAEPDHIDPSYRSVFYKYFSSRFFDMGRRSVRLSFFEGNCSVNDLISAEDLTHWEDSFIGSCVLNPIGRGVLGRTLLAPQYCLDSRAYVRVSRFKQTIYGRRLVVEAFPYRKQDGEALRCAEVTLLNLMDYYSNEYTDYGVALPARIIELEEEFSHERATPSRGIDYYTLTKIINRLGFAPRLHNHTETESAAWSGFRPGSKFRKLLYWYLDSGIPVAVNVNPDSRLEDGHSLISIGYEPLDSSVACHIASRFRGENVCEEGFEKADRIIEDAEVEAYHFIVDISEQDIANDGEIDGEDGRKSPSPVSCVLYHSVDFYSKCITIDDGNRPYASAEYPFLAGGNWMIADNITLALHRGMALEALDAYDDFISIVTSASMGLGAWGREALSLHKRAEGNESDSGAGRDSGCCQAEDERIVMRMFLASVRSFKRDRTENRRDPLHHLYARTPFPHFVWVMELYFAEYYFCEEEGGAFAEIILDATSAGKEEPWDKIVWMRYPGHTVVRGPNESFPTNWIETSFEPKENDVSSGINPLNVIRPFKSNLKLFEPTSFLGIESHEVSRHKRQHAWAAKWKCLGTKQS